LSLRAPAKQSRSCSRDCHVASAPRNGKRGKIRLPRR